MNTLHTHTHHPHSHIQSQLRLVHIKLVHTHKLSENMVTFSLYLLAYITF